MCRLPWEYRHFNNIWSSSHDHGTVFPFLCVIFNFFYQCVIVESRSSTFLVRFIPRYLIYYYYFFGTIVNGIVFLIPLSAVSLFVYRNSTGFCILILHPVTLLNSFISSCRFLVESFRFSLYNIMSSTNSENFISSLPIWIFKISFLLSDCCN